MERGLLLLVFVGAFYVSLIPASVKASSVSNRTDLNNIIDAVQQKVADLQIKENVHLVLEPPYQPYMQYGAYLAYITLYLHGRPPNSIRDVISFVESDSSVQLYVNQAILEAALVPNGPLPSDDQLLASVDAMKLFHGTGEWASFVYYFPRGNEYSSVSNHSVSCGFTNKDYFSQDVETLTGYYKQQLDEIGLGALADEIANMTFSMIKQRPELCIPVDFDNTFLNLGFGTLLKSYSKTSSRPYEAWLSTTNDTVAIMDALKKYAYRPFSSNVDQNSINPAIFFVMREFIYNAAESGRPLALAPTFVESISEIKYDFDTHSLPFQVNTVDIGVIADIIHGMTSFVLDDIQNPSDWFDEDVQSIYNDSAHLLAWQIERNYSDRPDLTMTYYTSPYTTLWTTSRTLNLLASSPSLPYKVMEDVLVAFKTAMRVHATDIILNAAHVDNDSDSAAVYFEDFLGVEDTTLLSRPKNRGDDRIRCTALVVSTLFFTWTENFQFIPDTPKDVQRIIVQASEWLIDNTLSGKYKPIGLLCGIEYKTYMEYPPYYPHNYVAFVNSSSTPQDCDISELGGNLIVAVSGVVPNATYQQLLEKECYIPEVPVDFHGYNGPDVPPFVYINSDAIAYSAVLLALSQYRAVYDILMELL